MKCKIKLINGDIVYCDEIYDFSTKERFFYKDTTHKNGIYHIEEIKEIIPLEPFELFGVECGKGWNNLIKPLFDYIKNYNKNKTNNDKIIILQVKEKFGELCFYVDNSTEELDELIRKAEDKSYETCEICGSTENIGHTTGWITTICENCIRNKAISSGLHPFWIDYKTKKKFMFDEKGNKIEV